jgi:hypothetical protein
MKFKWFTFDIVLTFSFFICITVARYKYVLFKASDYNLP